MGHRDFAWRFLGRLEKRVCCLVGLSWIFNDRHQGFCAWERLDSRLPAASVYAQGYGQTGRRDRERGGKNFLTMPRIPTG